MTPARPHCVRTDALGDVDDELHVGVVIVVGTAWHRHELVGELDVGSVGLDVVGRGHGDELDHVVAPKGLKGPLPDGTDALDTGDAIVSDKHAAQGPLPPVRPDKLLEGHIVEGGLFWERKGGRFTPVGS